MTKNQPGQATEDGETSEPCDTPAITTGDPDQAWRVLDLVNEWLKHAETKAAGTLVTSGVVAGVLYNLLKSVSEPGAVILFPAIFCAALIVAASMSSAWALRPRLWHREKPSSSLYFDHIARSHPRWSRGIGYVDAVRTLSADKATLVKQIAEQIWANAHVARTKYQWAGIGLITVFFALVSLALTAVAVAVSGW